MAFDMDGYVDVAERIRLFYEKFPDGRLTRFGEPEIREVGPKLFVIYTALAYRTVDDPHPAVGTAWELFPGPSSFTRDSELMNAETAAWGRAIVACGIGAKKIASVQEVQARRATPIPPEKVPANVASDLVDFADRIGVLEVLQAAASHAARRDVGDCSTTETARQAVESLSVAEAAAVQKWLDKKADEVAA